MGRTVLVTGVSGSLGAKVAKALAADSHVGRVVGVDAVRPRQPLGRVEFVHANLYDGSLRALIDGCEADTVLHMGLAVGRDRARRRRAAGENHLLGAMQLLAACQDSARVRRLVVRSTTTVYGSAPEGDAVDVERHVSAVARRRPDLSIAVLRCAHIIGPSVRPAVTRHFGRALLPAARREDPAVHFLHEDDGVEAIRRMALSWSSGVFDVAASDALRLSQCLIWAGRPEVPLPERGLRVLGHLVRRGRFGEYDAVRRLCEGGVADCGRIERALGWRPRYSSEQAFAEYLAQRRPEPREARRRPRRHRGRRRDGAHDLAPAGE